MNDRTPTDPVSLDDHLDRFAGQLKLLLADCAALERGGAILIADAEWVELYRLLTELQDPAVEAADPSVIAPMMFRLGLKLTVLEVLVDAYGDVPALMRPQ